jgi:hypothetical protein
MLDEPIKKERLVSDWSRNTNVSVTRTSAIIKSSDTSLVQFFAKGTEETNRTTSEYMKQLQPMLTSQAEKDAYKTALEVRDTYQQSRNKALELKADGQIVGSIRRVTDIIGEITAATKEQRSGIGQINDAVSQMDQVTQQNAALVEEAAAVAASMQDQARRLARVVSVFKVEEGAVRGHAVPRRALEAGLALPRPA